MRIREANKNDCVKLGALLTKLIQYESRYDTNLNPDYTVTDNYNERLDQPGHKAFVAENDEESVYLC